MGQIYAVNSDVDENNIPITSNDEDPLITIKFKYVFDETILIPTILREMLWYAAKSSLNWYISYTQCWNISIHKG